MALTTGSPDVKIGLIDGPVFTGHPELASEHILALSGKHPNSCTAAHSAACQHGTFIAGILVAKRTSPTPGICSDCTLLARPIFPERIAGKEQIPVTTPRELAKAILECMNAGVRVINLSLALAEPSLNEEPTLQEALQEAVKRGVIVVAAAGNQGTLGTSEITRHPWVIPVVACDHAGRPMNDSNISHSIGKRGVSSPGESIVGLNPDQRSFTLSGTSVAAPFVTGTVALLWSEFPSVTAAQIKLAILQASVPKRSAMIPPLLNAMMAYRYLQSVNTRRKMP
jgi:subtilisin family serine protease